MTIRDNQLAQAFGNIAAALTHTRDLDEMLDRILNEMARALPYDAADIMVMQDGTARVTACRGYAERGLEEAIRSLAVAVEEWPVVQAGKPRILADTTQDAGWHALPAYTWIGSHASAPIRLDGAVVGLLNIGSAAPGAFTADLAAPLQAFADQAALALRQARLHTQLQDEITRRERAEHDLMESEVRSRALFDHLPIAVSEQDFSGVRQYLNTLRDTGISDLRAYFDTNPDALNTCAGQMKVLDLNATALRLLHLWEKVEYGDKLDQWLDAESRMFLKEGLIALAEGAHYFTSDETHAIIAGRPFYVVFHLAVAPGYEDSWERVYVSLVDISERKRAENALRESEGLLHSLLDHMPAVVFVKDLQGRFVLINRRCEEWFGYTTAQVQGKTAHDLMPSAAADEITRREQHLLASQEPVYFEETIFDKNSVHTFWTGLFVLRDSTGQPYAMCGISSDITERKQVERALERRTHILRKLHEIDLEIGTDLGLSAVAERILTYTNGLLNARHSRIYLYNSHDNTFDLVGASGTPPGTLVTIDDHFVRQAVSSGQILPRDLDGVLTIPLFDQRSILGVLVIAGKRETRDPVDEQLWLAPMIAARITVAIQRARLFEAEREQRALAETLRDIAAELARSLDLDHLLHLILTSVGRVIPHDETNIMFTDFEQGLTRTLHSRNTGPNGAPEVFKNVQRPISALDHRIYQRAANNQPVLIQYTRTDPRWEDAAQGRWIQSYVGAPIFVQGRLVGIINVDSATPGFFTTSHAEQLKTLSDQAAIAIHNAQLYAEISRYATRLEERIVERTAELEAKTVQLQAILEGINEGVIYDEEFRIKYTNRALTELLGFSQEELNDVMIQDFNFLSEEVDMSHFTAQVQGILKREGVWKRDLRLRRKDGQEFDASMTITLITTPSGSEGGVTIIRDISQQKALQMQKERFITHAAHELRTPLSIFKTRLYLAQRQPDLAAQHLAVLDHITDQMDDLVEQLLSITRLIDDRSTLERQRLAVPSLIDEIVTARQTETRRADIDLTHELPPTPLYILAHHRSIYDAFDILIHTAIQRVGPGGKIRLHVLPDEMDHQNLVTVQVWDNGPSLSPQELAYILEPFGRASEGAMGGSGLRLMIVKRIVELHGGSISVRNEAEGITFRVQLASIP